MVPAPAELPVTDTPQGCVCVHTRVCNKTLGTHAGRLCGLCVPCRPPARPCPCAAGTGGSGDDSSASLSGSMTQEPRARQAAPDSLSYVRGHGHVWPTEQLWGTVKETGTFQGRGCESGALVFTRTQKENNPICPKDQQPKCLLEMPPKIRMNFCLCRSARLWGPHPAKARATGLPLLLAHPAGGITPHPGASGTGAGIEGALLANPTLPTALFLPFPHTSVTTVPSNS